MSQPKPCDVAAYFWPAYHDEPRWRRFMPDGEGEWETIRKARPKFDGHRLPRVPLWGYEDESNPRAMERKIDAASDHGVNVLIFDWYWYENQPFLEDALTKGFMGAKNNSRIRYFLMWANHDATTAWDLTQADENRLVWPGAVDRVTFDIVVGRVIERFFKHPSYYTIDGKPVFSIYDLSNLIKGLGGMEATRAALASFRERTRMAGFPDLHLQAILWGQIPAAVSLVPGDRTETQNSTVVSLGFDSLTNYQWCHNVKPDGPYRAWAEKSVAQWQKWSDSFSLPFYPHVSVGWDTNPRFRKVCSLITENTPELFGEYMRKAVAFVDERGLSPRLITVNAWNEWSESSYLEPDTVNGMRYLEAIRDAVLESGGGRTVA